MLSETLQLTPRDFIPYTGQGSIDFRIPSYFSQNQTLTLFSEKEYLRREVIAAYRNKFSELLRGVSGRRLRPENLVRAVERGQEFLGRIKPAGFPVTLRLDDGQDTYHISHQKGKMYLEGMMQAGILEYIKEEIDPWFNKARFLDPSLGDAAKNMRLAINQSQKDVFSLNLFHPSYAVYKNLPERMSRAVGLEQLAEQRSIHSRFLPSALRGTIFAPSYA